MKYKVGDKVVIKSQKWYDENKDSEGNVNDSKKIDCFSSGMKKYLGMTAYITSVHDLGPRSSYYTLNIDNNIYAWNDFMFEDLKNNEILIPEGYEFDKVENNRIILKKKKL